MAPRIRTTDRDRRARLDKAVVLTILRKYSTYLSKATHMSTKNTKRERFERLAVYRTNEVLRKLKVLGNCSNRSAYDYDEADIQKIFVEIERRVKETRARFHYTKRKAFKL